MKFLSFSGGEVIFWRLARL